MKINFSIFAIHALLFLISSNLNSFGDEPSPSAPSTVYARVVLPVGHPYLKRIRESDRKTQPVRAVENWITNKSLQIGQTKVVAVTDWVPISEKATESTNLLDGPGCPVSAWVERTQKGKIKVELPGWAPAAPTTISVLLSLGQQAPIREVQL